MLKLIPLDVLKIHHCIPEVKLSTLSFIIIFMIKIKLSEIMGRKRIRPVDLAKMTGLSKTTIHKLYYEKNANLGVDTLDKLCKALDCKITDLLEYIPD